jgi:hypothetical protein
VNLKFDVQRVGLNLCKSGLGATYRARVSWIEHERRILKTHVSSLRPTPVRCGLRTLKKRLVESWVEARALLLLRSILLILRSQKRKICIKLLT